jgi:hypothetical protein
MCETILQVEAKLKYRPKRMGMVEIESIAYTKLMSLKAAKAA